MPNNDTMLRMVESEAMPVRVIDMLPGDLLLFQFGRQNYPNHLAVVSGLAHGTAYFIHAYNALSSRGVTESALKEEYVNAFVGVYRLPEFFESERAHENYSGLRR